jgi:uncharacterized protein YndB with AHSA1/START domain
MATQQKAVARVSRQYRAAPERVFDAWLDPEKVKLWWRASAVAAGRGTRETLERVTIDARVGGRFSILVRRDGKLLDHTGVYQEIDRPRRLVFTWNAIAVDQSSPSTANDESRVIIEIAARPTGCEVTLAHEMSAEWSDFVDRAANAWNMMLTAIDELVSE